MLLYIFQTLKNVDFSFGLLLRLSTFIGAVLFSICFIAKNYAAN